jgi:dolichol kinase
MQTLRSSKLPPEKSLEVPSPAWRLKLRNDLHLARKTFHCGMGVFMALVYLLGLPKGMCIGLLFAAFTFFSTLEYLRLKVPRFNAVAIRIMGPIMRTSEITRVSGTPFYIASVLLSVAVFPKTIAILSILFLAVGDPVSSIFGILWGDLGPRFSNGKSLIGTAAGMGICSVIAMVSLLFIGVPSHQAILISLAGGFAGGGAEMLPLDIDDNFSIPLVSGLALWLAFIFFGV